MVRASYKPEGLRWGALSNKPWYKRSSMVISIKSYIILRSLAIAKHNDHSAMVHSLELLPLERLNLPMHLHSVVSVHRPQIGF